MRGSERYTAGKSATFFRASAQGRMIRETMLKTSHTHSHGHRRAYFMGSMHVPESKPANSVNAKPIRKCSKVSGSPG
jgi:hypothetical protein